MSSTREKHEELTAAAGARLKAAAEASGPEGRKKAGMCQADLRRAVAILKANDLEWWRLVKRLEGEFKPEVLAGWKDEIERLARDGEGRMMPGGRRTGAEEREAEGHVDGD